jgi:hypothetical protein
MANKKLKIWCYDTESETLYELYTQTNLPEAYDSVDRIVDARSYPENGKDILYFTDNYHEVRQLRCEIPTPYTANFLSDYDLSLQKYGANGTISFNTATAIATGGTLLSGTYQFAYRLLNPTTKTYTKWSSLTNSVHIYNKIEASYAVYASGYGLATNRKIVMSINPSAYEMTAVTNGDLTHFQLAVIENVTPVDTLEASLLAVEPIASRTNYEYKANYNIGKISVDEIVIDSAAIKTSKTVAISQNRLFAGNVQYQNLQFDNGTPSLDTTSNQFITYSRSNDVDLELEKNLSFRKGYFRNEVYRFAIVYFDKYGNKSEPQVLNMTNVSGNTISGATDVKFPQRSSSYPILNASHNPVDIGLRLNIKNHPTWAVGFEIVREKRIKNVLFQTPMIPMMSVKGIGALDTYPTVTTVRTSGTTTLSYTSAQPQTADEVFVPKNLMWPELRNITPLTSDSNVGTNYEKIQGEVKLTRGTEFTNAVLYPQSSIYENKEYTFTGAEEINTIDYVLAKAKFYNYNASASFGAYGDDINQEFTTTFFALQNNYYYSNSGSYSSVIENTNIVDGIYLDNATSGNYLSGSRVNFYGNLNTEGYQLGFTPVVQRSVACKLKNSFFDEGSKSIVFPVGTHNAYTGGAYIVGSSGYTYTADTAYPNDFTIQTSHSVNDAFQVIRLVNVLNSNVGDDRYGKTDAQREYISTGAKYSFSQFELDQYINKAVSYPVLIDVWGGDCCVTSHTFKVCDSTYSVINQRKHMPPPHSFITGGDLLLRWGKIFKITGSTTSYISLPVALKGNAQYVQVFLESEYNGQAMDVDILSINSASPLVQGKSLVLGGEEKLSARTSIKTNLTYNYNKNLLIGNEQKTYFTLPEGFNPQYNFGARVHYSDIKLYNSPVQGFDTFRVLDYYDLEEAGGNITKLALAGDNMFAIQQKRIVYLPVGNRQVETADSGILTVGTSTVLSQARLIDPLRGSQHLAGIVEAGGIVLIPDMYNKAVYMLGGEQISIISDSGVASTFRSNFGTLFDEKNLRGVYDPIRKEYWIFSNTNPKFCLVYNFGLEQWISNYEFDASTLYGGRYTNQKLYLLGKVSNQIAVYSMYTGEYTNLMGTEVTPRVTFVVNPDGDYAKTFDDVMISATERLENVDFVVDREISMGDQTVSEVNLDVFPVEGNYRIKTLRDPRNERLRGVRMKSTVRWKKNNIASTISAVYTKYRLSSRSPF